MDHIDICSKDGFLECKNCEKSYKAWTTGANPKPTANNMINHLRSKAHRDMARMARAFNPITTSTSNYPTGQFQNPGYGEVKIEPYKKALLLTYYNLKLVLIPKGEHLFSSHYLEDEGVEKGGVGNVVFKFDKSGALQSFQIPFEPMVKDIVFVKQSSQ